MRILLVQTGNTLPSIAEEQGDFDAMFHRGLLGEEREHDLVLVDPRNGDALPAPSDYDAVVVTGSAAMVTQRLDWSERTKEWLPGVVEAQVPLLAVCYGHQLLAEGLGGQVGANPLGREIGTIQVELTAQGQTDALFGALESPTLRMQATHVESVLRLPAGALLMGTSPLDPHQAFRVGDRAWAVQFHPELDDRASRGYIEGRAERIREEGLDPDALLATVSASPDGHRLLRRFVAIAREFAETEAGSA
ncbi:MAG: GMP synthase [Sandaracinus sp.]|nr:GMP synthase [Sandaracinus sp.]